MAKLNHPGLNQDPMAEENELIVEDDGSEALEYVQQLISRMNNKDSSAAPLAPAARKPPASVPATPKPKAVTTAHDQPKPTASVEVAEDEQEESMEGSNLSTASLLAKLSNPAEPVEPDPVTEPEEEAKPKPKPKKRPKPADSRADINRMREAANITSQHALKTFGSKQDIRRAYFCLFFTLFFAMNALLSRVISDPHNAFANYIIYGSHLASIAGTIAYFKLVKKVETSSLPTLANASQKSE